MSNTGVLVDSDSTVGSGATTGISAVSGPLEAAGVFTTVFSGFQWCDLDHLLETSIV